MDDVTVSTPAYRLRALTAENVGGGQGVAVTGRMHWLVEQIADDFSEIDEFVALAEIEAYVVGVRRVLET